MWAIRISRAQFLPSPNLQSGQVGEASELGPQKEVGKDPTAGLGATCDVGCGRGGSEEPGRGLRTLGWRQGGTVGSWAAEARR